MEEMKEFLSDPIVWYSLAFVVCLALLFRFARKPIVGMLDAEIEKIRAELASAEKMRGEAEAAWRAAETKQQQALAEAEAILRHAKDEAARLGKEAEEALAQNMARQEQRALDRIRQAEKQALDEVRLATIDLAMKAAREQLEQNIGDAAARLVQDAIREVPRLAEGSRS